MTHPLEAGLRAGVASLGLELTEAQVQTLLAYQDWVAKWNRVYNLTALRDPQEMLTHHLLDSLAVVQPLRRHLAQQGQGAQPAQVNVWLGPCIGPRQFEVGADVLLAFGQDPAAPDDTVFVLRPRPDGSARWLAHLPRLAARRLQAVGVRAITDAAMCTVEDPSRFFSYRRDGRTGRMVAAIWRT